jgi:hypothetical protein
MEIDVAMLQATTKQHETCGETIQRMQEEIDEHTSVPSGPNYEVIAKLEKDYSDNLAKFATLFPADEAVLNNESMLPSDDEPEFAGSVQAESTLPNNTMYHGTSQRDVPMESTEDDSSNGLAPRKGSYSTLYRTK